MAGDRPALNRRLAASNIYITFGNYFNTAVFLGKKKGTDENGLLTSRPKNEDNDRSAAFRAGMRVWRGDGRMSMGSLPRVRVLATGGTIASKAAGIDQTHNYARRISERRSDRLLPGIEKIAVWNKKISRACSHAHRRP